jgi:hypothetical protein
MAPTGRINAPSQNTPYAFSSAAVSFAAGKNAFAILGVKAEQEEIELLEEVAAGRAQDGADARLQLRL